MTTSDKIIIGSTVVVAASAITMLTISKRCETMTDKLLSELEDTHQTVNRIQLYIDESNKEIARSNQLLRKIVVKSAENHNQK